MILDFRRNPPAPPPLTIMDSTVTAVQSFIYLGTIISQDLKWDNHIVSMVKKAQQRLYFLHQLRKFNLPQELLIQFYSAIIESVLCTSIMALFHCMVRHGTVRYGSLLGGFPLGTVPGTWYFFSTTSAEVPSEPYRYQNVTCKLYWSLIGRRELSLLRHWTCDTRPSSTALPARFKSAQPAKDRTQLLFKQTHIFASTTK